MCLKWYCKVCVRWILWMHIHEQKGQQMQIRQNLMNYKYNWMWHFPGPQHHKEKSSRQSSVGKVVCTVFLDRKYKLEFFWIWTNQLLYCTAKLKNHISRFGSEKKVSFHVQHTNVRPFISFKAYKFGPATPTISSELTFSNFPQFRLMKNGLYRHFSDNYIVTAAMKKCVTSTGANFYKHNMLALVNHW